ncbi:hypothetical protein E8D34_20425 [Nocardioides sp. GY 10113]|uniref:hypothetical protein n=1 Tax=Nocardioides sp. GY 10113 TaxID=2569761 RepID=UPI0010A80D40|nr:hypothetical protein [Nocardioides sp. GY 10113]TIC79235.1 hypothetical protein E8D34_20425 [Nocardioides sp. GY 10113]
MIAVLLGVATVAAGAVALGGSLDPAGANTSVRDERLSDLTGIARSTYDRDLVWAVGGPSAGAAVYAIAPNGTTAARVALGGATNDGWQDVAAGPDNTLWVLGPGRSSGGSTLMSVYRISEPSSTSQTWTAATEYRLSIPGTGSRGASLLVSPWSGRLLIATEEAGGGTLYGASPTLAESGTNSLSRVRDIPANVTGAAFAPGGHPMVLVTADRAYLDNGRYAQNTTQALPAGTDVTGVSIDRSGRTLLVADASGPEILTLPLESAPATAGPTSATTSAPTAPARTTSPTTTTTTTTPPQRTVAPTTTSSSPTSRATTTTSSAGVARTPSGTMALSMYNGSFAYDTFRSLFGSYPAVETTYLNADQVTTPNIRQHQAQIDRGVSPVITLGYKNGPFTRAQIAAWGSNVQSYYRTFVAGLKTLSDYAAAANNGTRVYFADEHEAQVKINQDKYSFSGYGSSQVPTTAASAAAWNQVMGYVRSAAPNVIRTYWYGGSGANEDTFASLLTPSLIQMATFDPYRWKHNSPSDTPQRLWASKISSLKSKSWMRNSDGSLKPWGLTEWGTDVSMGDTSNATFVTQAVDYLRSEGASFAVYFNRTDGNNSTNKFTITDGKSPRTLAAFRTAVSGG